MNKNNGFILLAFILSSLASACSESASEACAPELAVGESCPSDCTAFTASQLNREEMCIESSREVRCQEGRPVIMQEANCYIRRSDGAAFFTIDGWSYGYEEHWELCDAETRNLMWTLESCPDS